ncbi:MAG: lipopolysaccharide biosynthesis protein [Muribaculaceae bacterium]|nr:lipopolysaccharide biosynthesis protein [Muribaculaceae bacterium]
MTDNTDKEASLKLKTARTLKWNTIDRLASQVLYGVVGVVLANVLSQEDFGLVGALLVFQAFAIIFADSGFGAALLQQKNPTEEDYSTVFWFNLAVSVGIYVVLWFGAPVIADIFQGDRRLIPLSKVMFLTFVLNALAIVQINRLMKRMDVKMIAVSNLAGQIAGGIVGVALALSGYGAWALVWQSVVMAGVKTGILWITGKWRPKRGWSEASFKKIWRIGFSVFSSTLLNTVFLNIYSFVIGSAYSLRSLGVYTQADKWSKMGSASLSQVLTASFVPVLSKVQDSEDDYRRYVKRINRFTGFILFPFMIGLAAVGTNLFHMLFGTAWDAAIIMFQILVIRGIFVVLVSLYSNYMLAKGFGKRLFMIEVIKDGAIALAILATMFEGSVDLLVWGQLWASVVAWVIIVVITSRAIGYKVREMVRDLVPFLAVALVMWGVCFGVEMVGERLIGSTSFVNSKVMPMTEDTEGLSACGDASEAGEVDEARSVGSVGEVEGVGSVGEVEEIGEVGDLAGVGEVRSLGEAEGTRVVGEVRRLGEVDSVRVVGEVSEVSEVDGVGVDGCSDIAEDSSGIMRIHLRFVAGLILVLQVIIGGSLYVLLSKACGFPEYHEAIGYLFGRFRKKSR